MTRPDTAGTIEPAEWTEADFDTLSWHDNAVHAIRIAEGEHGLGRLILDIDYIVEWNCAEEGAASFRIAPATLEFREVANLRIALDYVTPGAGLTPFSLDRIDRRTEHRERYDAIVWTLIVNWPAGSISFEAAGFRQTLRGPARWTSEQRLTAEQRANDTGTRASPLE